MSGCFFILFGRFTTFTSGTVSLSEEPESFLSVDSSNFSSGLLISFGAFRAPLNTFLILLVGGFDFFDAVLVLPVCLGNSCSVSRLTASLSINTYKIDKN